jgi:hypothetical protein
VPAALLCGTLAAAKWARATAFPGLARALSTVIRATRSDAKSDAGKGKAPPSRRFKSVRCRSQERFAYLSKHEPLGPHRDNHPGRTAPERRNTNPVDTRCVRKLVIPLPQRLLVRPINVAELGQTHVARLRTRSARRRSRPIRSRIRTNMPGGANLKALAVALPMPRFIGQLFGFDRDALTENAIGKLAVAALTLKRRDDAHAPGV